MARELRRRGNEMLNSHGRWVKRNNNDDIADNEWIWRQNETTGITWTSTLPLPVPSESDTEQELNTTNFPNAIQLILYGSS